MVTIFLLAGLFCVYTYAGFPIWLALRARRLPAPNKREGLLTERQDFTVSNVALPAVSVIIAAHNEQDNLPLKIQSLLEQNYPAEQIQIVVVSDGSSDKTVELLQDSEVTLEHYTPAKGKPTALNRGVAIAEGEIVVFTDARQILSANAIRALVARFDDPTIGVVSGELMMRDPVNRTAASVGLYWSYEKWIRKNESDLHSTTGATGALYAIRKQHITALREETLLDDFEIPAQALKAGYRSVFEPLAHAYDDAEADSSNEFRRKTRTLAGNFQSFHWNSWLFNPSKNPVWWQFISHKVFRLLIPLALVIALLASVVGAWQGQRFLGAMLLAQGLFYGSGLAATLLPSLSGNRYLSVIKTFLQLNAAVVVGAYKFYSDTVSVRWKPSS